MAVTVQDPTRQRDPSSRHAFPELIAEPKMRAPRTLAEELLAAVGARTSERQRNVAAVGGVSAPS